MFVESPELDRRELVSSLERTWGLRVGTIKYEPVGFGSHHYLVSDKAGFKWFVTVDALPEKSWYGGDVDLAFEAQKDAFTTVVALRRAGLEFVHAPVEAPDGTILVRFDDRHAASVFEFVDGTSNASGEYRFVEERRRVLHCLGRLHAVLDAVPRELPRRDLLEVPLRDSLLEALERSSEEWSGGPYSEPARRLLSIHETMVLGLLDRFDELRGVVESRSNEWVITHGEPHGGNVMRTNDGNILLIDWDTVLLGPRERDLWMIEPRDADDWAAYISAGASDPPDASAMEFYQVWWKLAEIAGYTDGFRRPHEDDANMKTAWEDLQTYLPAN